jgi:hypothetical protein
MFWAPYSIGDSMPRALRRRRRWCQISRYSNIAFGQLDPRVPAPAIQGLNLHSGPERLDHRVVVAVALAAHRADGTGDVESIGIAHGQALSGFERSSQLRDLQGCGWDDRQGG